MESTSMMNSATALPVVGTVAFGLITIVSCSYLFRRKLDKKFNETKSHSATDLQPSGTAEPSNPNSRKVVNDAWEERRQRGIQAASLHTKKDITGKKDKPFGSSYYYAHNSTKTTGGYKDGLTMEDYTMNGPRLLSRNGTPVVNEDPSIASCQPEPIESGCVKASDSNSMRIEQPRRRVIPVSKYLWDDPGSNDGIATIRVDTLATFKANCSESIEWKMVRPFITSIDASLTGVGKDKDGLFVKIQAVLGTSEGIGCSTLIDNLKQTRTVEYVLQIQKLYGHVQRVECVSKDKRLLIRLYKQSTIFDKSNLKAWPHPQKTIA
jgi:hypothetical protein